MLILTTTLVLAGLAPQAGVAVQTPPEVPVLNAKIGTCSADFTVKDASGAPIYLALVNVRVRYGAMNIKRMDLEVGTNSDGLARITGLPSKAKPLTYEVTKGDKKATVEQDVAKTCEAKLQVTLPKD
jgi:hypothetical protein